MPAGPLLAWKRGDLKGVAERLTLAAGIAATAAAIILSVTKGGSLLIVAGLFCAIYAIVGALTESCDRIQLFRAPAKIAAARAVGLPRSAFGMLFAHLGIGISLLGVIAEAGWSQERIVALKAGDRVSISDFDVSFKGIEEREGANWRDRAGRFEVRRGGVMVATIESSKRVYVASSQTTTEAGIKTFGFGQLYISLGDAMPGGTVSARIYWKPAVLLIWLGGIVMALGGALSLSDRRLRIGAPKPARRTVVAPAE
jgi:cytochrome c-type biogenesis protein CcmF